MTESGYRKVVKGFFSFLFLMFGSVKAESLACSVVAYEFSWRGQFAGFMVKGRFSYNENDVPKNGIIREENLLALDVSFYDPKGRLMRTYTDNHKFPVDKKGSPYVNFAFDTITEEILQTGSWNVDDNDRRFRNGLMLGEGNPDLRSQVGVQSGLAFWSRPNDNVVPHLHFDDWNNEFGFPIGFSSHEDASFPTRTTQERIDTGRVGTEYFQRRGETVVVNRLASDVGEFGQWARVWRAKPSSLDQRDQQRCLQKSR